MATLFPIGTIVKLKDNDQNLMVAGYGGANAQGAVFDYIGLPCPVGIINKNLTVLFNDAQIETLRYMGYIDAPTQAYIAKVEDAGHDQLPVFKSAGAGAETTAETVAAETATEEGAGAEPAAKTAAGTDAETDARAAALH